VANLGYIQVTRACNQNCRFCSNPDTGRTISLSQARKYISDYAKKAYVGVLFTGGEPTLHADLGEMISYADKKGIESRIITNGQRTSDIDYFRSLVDCGLKYVMVSVYSKDPKVQEQLSGNKESLANIKKTLKNVGTLGITVNIITVINKYNVNHLSETVEWLVKDYPFIRHFIWNNLDPLNNKTSQNPDTIPSLNDFELELHKAMVFLEANHRTFRVERVPLCYMAGFEQYSTEARKIIKDEERSIYFLDEKGYVKQKGSKGFLGYMKTECCRFCALNDICPGLYAGGKGFSLDELYPVFVSKNKIIRKVFNGG